MSKTYTVSTRINKPVGEVFAAVVSREQLERYFTDSADADLAPGRKVTWNWKDWGDHPVVVDVFEPDARIELLLNSKDWNKTSSDPYDVRVIMTFEASDDGATVVSISEEGWKTDEPGLKASHENCGGWMHMIMCLKGWLEHGVDLRR